MEGNRCFAAQEDFFQKENSMDIPEEIKHANETREMLFPNFLQTS